MRQMDSSRHVPAAPDASANMIEGPAGAINPNASTVMRPAEPNRIMRFSNLSAKGYGSL